MKDNKVVNKILTVLKVVLTVLVLSICLIIIVQKVTNNKFTIGGISIYTIASNSMSPYFEIGDMLLAKSVDSNSLQVGDDIVYQGEKGSVSGKIITHRLIKVDNDNDIFVTKGINNTAEDPSIESRQIYGLVIYKFKFLSFLSKLLMNDYIFYFIVFVPFTVLIFFDIVGIIKDKKELENSGE